MEPTDVIALTGVGSTAVVAVVSLVIQAQGAEKQREHDRQIADSQREHDLAVAWDTRSWDAKSQTLLSAVREARTLLDAAESKERSPAHFVRFGRAIYKFHEASDAILPQLETYTSETTRTKWLEVREAVRWGRVATDGLDSIEALESEKQSAISRSDFDTAGAARIAQHDAVEVLHGDMEVADDLEALLAQFIEIAREDAQGARSGMTPS